MCLSGSFIGEFQLPTRRNSRSCRSELKDVAGLATRTKFKCSVFAASVKRVYMKLFALEAAREAVWERVMVGPASGASGRKTGVSLVLEAL